MDETILTRLYKYCAYQDRCTSEIENKLREYEVPATQQAMYLEHLIAERFLDDVRYTRSFVRGKFAYKQWGPIKIKYALRGKGISGSLIDDILAEEIAPDAYQQTLRKLAEAKWDQWAKEVPLTRKEKTARFLTQKGYPWSDIAPLLDILGK